MTIHTYVSVVLWILTSASLFYLYFTYLPKTFYADSDRPYWLQASLSKSPISDPRPCTTPTPSLRA